MNLNNHVTLSRTALVLGLAAVSGNLGHAANNVALPNILWHNKATGGTRVWIMNGTSFATETLLPTTSDNLAWRAVGTGDFNRDGDPDIVWQNESTGQNAVWYMRGTIMMSAALIPSAGDLSWRIVGVGDFNSDGKPDLVWQNVIFGLNAVWLMDNAAPQSYHLITSAGDPNWRIVATGDLNLDGKTDIVLRNRATGQNAVWYMNGLQLSSGDFVRAPNGSDVKETDQDWHIVGLADYNSDNKPDLLWRHTTLGLNVCWFLNNNILVGSTYLNRHEFDTDWRICSQETADSTWRLDTAESTSLQAVASSAPPQVQLTFKVPPNSGFGVTLQRRLMTDTSWTTLATRLTGNTFTDTTVVSGRSYEYRAFREGFNGTQYSAAEHTSVALNAPAIEDRGRVILLVDKTLANSMTTSLEQLRQDLIGDGWKVIRHDVPRHIDDYSSPTSFRTNAYNATNIIKPLIRAAVTSDPSTKAILIIGHVTIPYSGSFNPDGHTCGPPPFGPDHRGAWPADMFYGDLDGTWTDWSVNFTNCDFTEPNNYPNDGKFDQDGIPSPFIMKLGVGRVDFARLPVFTQTPPAGVAPKSELALLQQYLQKNHLFRRKALPWQQADPPARVMVYGHFHDSRDNQIFENARHTTFALSDDPGRLSVGDFCLQRSRPTWWGFVSGAGGSDRVNSGMPVLEHTAADLTHGGNEPKTVFYTVLSSYLGDWNLGLNNYLRSLLATPNFGLASMWTRFALWRTDVLGVGEHLGAAQQRMVNDPKNVFYDRSRDLTILGDSTLRPHILAPPANLTAQTTSPGGVQLNWTGSESGAQYYVYRAASLAGPFTRISASAVSGTSFTDSSPSAGQKTYMVRTIRLLRVGTGSFTNISQGTFVQAN